jgi:hypothetical protein
MPRLLRFWQFRRTFDVEFDGVKHFSAPRDDTARAVCGNGAKSELLL